MIRIERTQKEGRVRVFVQGEELRLPPKGSAIVLTPSVTHKAHLEDVRPELEEQNTR